MSGLTETISESDARERVESLRGAASPQAQVDLAKALLTLSQALDREGRTGDAVDAAEEAVRTLAPIFLASPAPHAEAMNAMVAAYLGMSQRSKRKPDLALIKPLAVPLGQVEYADDDD